MILGRSWGISLPKQVESLAQTFQENQENQTMEKPPWVVLGTAWCHPLPSNLGMTSIREKTCGCLATRKRGDLTLTELSLPLWVKGCMEDR